MQAFFPQLGDTRRRGRRSGASTFRRRGGRAARFPAGSAISRMGFLRRRVDEKAQLGGEAHGPQHAHRVFAVALPGVADDAQGLLLQIGDAVVVIDHRLGGRVVVEGVGGEIAPRRVLRWLPKTLSWSTRPCSSVLASSPQGAAEGGDLQVSWPIMTCTIWKRRPMMRERRK